MLNAKIYPVLSAHQIPEIVQVTPETGVPLSKASPLVTKQSPQIRLKKPERVHAHITEITNQKSTKDRDNVCLSELAGRLKHC